MGEVSIEKLIKQLDNISPTVRGSVTTKSLNRIKNLFIRVAKTYTPISPTKGQYEESLVSGVSLRDDFNPGNLRKSIQEIGRRKGDIFIGVPSNSLAGRYADWIHNGDWKKLGPGSQRAKQEGEPVGKKYLDRPLEKLQKEGKFTTIVESEVDKALKKGNFT